MAERAPGFEPGQNEPSCYNCGMKGHMFMACPEPTRPVPAGLKEHWAQKNSAHIPNGDNSAHGQRSKGPIITRYPLPPTHSSSIPHRDPTPSQPYPLSRPPSFPPQPPQPPYDQRIGTPYAPPPNSLYDRYGPPGPPPPTQHVSPPPQQYPLYEYQRGPPHHIPPPNVHHGPPRPPHIPFPVTHGESHHGPPFPHDHLPPGQPDRHHHGYPSVQHDYHYNAPPQPPPRPPHYQDQGPPPPPNGYPPHPPGYQDTNYGPLPPFYYHPQDRPPGPPLNTTYREERERLDHPMFPERRLHEDPPPIEYFDRQEAWQRYPPPPGDRYGDDVRQSARAHESVRSIEPRRHDRSRYDKSRDERPRDRFDRSRPYERPERSDRGRWNKNRSRTASSRSNNRDTHATDSITPVNMQQLPDPEPGEIRSEGNSESDHEGTKSTYSIPDDESPYRMDSQEWKIAFKEAPPGFQADAIAAPLPAEYTEGVMIPPAYDATGVKSKYINVHNLDDFAQGIRETKGWQVMQYHPAFLDPMNIRVEKLEDYDRAIHLGPRHMKRDRPHTYEARRGRNKEPRGRSIPHRDLPSRDFHGQEDEYRADSRKRRWQETVAVEELKSYEQTNLGSDRRYREPERKRPKPASPEPGEVFESESQESLADTKTLSMSAEDQYSGLELGEFVENDTPGPSEGEKIEIRQASQRYSPARLAEKEPIRHEHTDDRGRNRKSGSKTLYISTEHRNNGYSPKSPPSSSARPLPYSRSPSRRNSRSHHGSDPNSRRSSVAEPASDNLGSPLTPTELELLGFGRPSSASDSNSGRESPKRQSNTTPKLKRRQNRVADAYSRRW